MMRYLSVVCLLLLTHFFISAQQSERCGTDAMVKEAFTNNPEALLRFEQMQSAINEITNSASVREDRNIIVSIPVVFHVIHSGQPVGTGFNISQAQMISQIEVLNECFRMRNSDTALIPAWFKDRKADVEIEFCLALYDAQGLLMSEAGVTRHNYANTANFDTNIKPATQWDPSKYLNIWTTQLTGNVLGYATIPGLFPLNQDGVVLDYRRVGKSPANPYAGANDRGRTAVHEVGHWLNLFHTFQDSCSGMTPQNCQLQGDFICDTPPAKEATYGQPNLLQNTCNESPVDENDMWMNYMDYVDDNQMHLFTRDQRDRMRATLLTIRNSLQSSLGCTNIANVFSYTGKVVDAADNTGVAGAKVLFDGQQDYELTTDANGNFTIPNLIDGYYDVYAGKWGYKTSLFSKHVLYSFGLPVYQIPIENHHYYDDFLFDYSWIKTNSASSGFWTRAVPFGTTWGNETAQPYTDLADDFGDKCFVTGNTQNTSADYDDVDNGNAILFSPFFDLSGFTDPYVRYSRWFFNGTINQNIPDDQMVVRLNNGNQQVVIESVTSNQNTWTSRTFRVTDFLQPTSSMRFIVEVNDLSASNPNITEGGIDRFEVVESTNLNLSEVEQINFSVFPNPSNGIAHVGYENPEGSEVKLTVMNMLGEVVLSKIIPASLSGQTLLDLNAQSVGVYFIRLHSTNSEKVLKFSLSR